MKPQTQEKPDYIAILRTMKDSGLTFSDCVKVFGVDRDSDPLASAAKRFYGEEGSLEFDDTLVVSGEACEGGAYVMCWQYVTSEMAGVETEHEDV